MMLDRDDHETSQQYEQFDHRDGLGGLRYVSPKLAHRRAADPQFLALVPGCPLCEATKIAAQEAWAAVREIHDSVTDRASSGKGLTDGSS